ncbi:MAG: DUF975 family protein [Bacilli bacterium]|nr:DUF975 family protein [Bacilli bacterium]
MNFSELKQNAKQSLKGKWGPTIGVLLLYTIITGCVQIFVTPKTGQDPNTTVQFSTSLVSLILTALLVLGYNTYFLKLSRNEEVEVGILWSKVNQFGRAFLATFLLGLVVGCGFILLIIPGIIFALMFSMTMYIMSDDKEISAIDAMKKSAEMMKGHKGELFLLYLSFFGWLILGLFTFGILYLWLIPYMETTICNFYNKIK